MGSNMDAFDRTGVDVDPFEATGVDPPMDPFEATGVDSFEATGVPEKTSFMQDIKAGVSNTGSALLRTAGDAAKVGAGLYNDYHPLSNVLPMDQPQEQDILDAQQGLRDTVGYDPKDEVGKEPGFGGKLTRATIGLAGTLGAAAANPVAGVAMAGSMAYGTARELEESVIKEGVASGMSEEEANAVAAKVRNIQMGAELVSQLIPLGGGVAKTALKMGRNVSLAGGANAVQGFLTDKYTQAVLEGKGLNTLAKNYNPYDWEDRTVDFLTGGVPVGVRSGYLNRKDAKLANQAKTKLDVLEGSLDTLKQTEAAEAAAMKQQANQQGKATQAEMFDSKQAPIPTAEEARANKPRFKLPLQEDKPDPQPQEQLSFFNKNNDPIANAIGAKTNPEKVAAAVEEATTKMKADFEQDRLAKLDSAAKDSMSRRESLPGYETLGSFANIDSIEQIRARPGTDLSNGVMDKFRNKMASGLRDIANLTNNKAIQYTHTLITRANGMAHQFVRNNVEPLADIYKKFTDVERVEVIRALQMGDNKQRRLDPESLQKAGFSETQQKFINDYYNASKKFLDIHNENLRAVGENPIIAREGHVPSRWRGDYVSFMMDKEGNTIGVIQEPTIYGLKDAQAYYKKMNPYVTFSEVGTKQLNDKNATDLVSGIRMVAKLAEITNNTTLKGKLGMLTAAAEAGGVQSAKSLFGFDKHELFKKGVDGYLGKKAWKSELDNANDMFKSIAEYFEEGSISSNHMKASGEINKLVVDLAGDLAQPNTAALLQEFSDTISGRKTNDIGQGVDAVLSGVGKMMGIGVGGVGRGVGRLENMAQISILGLGNLRFTATQLMQVIQSGLPNLVMLSRAVDGGIVKPHLEATKAMVHNMFLYANMHGAKSIDLRKVFTPDELDAIEFAKDQGMLRFSEFERVKSVGDSAGKNTAETIATFNMSFAEQMTRPPMYIAAFRMLKQAGYPQELAKETAANLTQSAMIDYHQNSRAMIYAQTGTLGRSAGRLRTFAHGYVTNFAVMAKKDPMAAAYSGLALTMLAGIHGIPLVDQGMDIYENITGKKLTDKINNTPVKDLVEFGALSAGTGVWFQPSFSMSSLVPAEARNWHSYMFPYLSYAGTAAVGAAKFLADPNTSTLGELAVKSAPGQVRGAAVEAFRRRPDNYRSDSRGNKDFPMTNNEWTAYRLGFTTTEVGKFSFRRYKTNQKNFEDDMKARELGRQLSDSFFIGERTHKDTMEKFQEYTKLMGPESAGTLLGTITKRMEQRDKTQIDKLLEAGSWSALRKLREHLLNGTAQRNREMIKK